MRELICESCGERNPAGAEFCGSCNAYLAWDPTMVPGTGGVPPLRPAPPSGPGPVPVAPPGARREPPPGPVRPAPTAAGAPDKRAAGVRVPPTADAGRRGRSPAGPAPVPPRSGSPEVEQFYGSVPPRPLLNPEAPPAPSTGPRRPDRPAPWPAPRPGIGSAGPAAAPPIGWPRPSWPAPRPAVPSAGPPPRGPAPAQPVADGETQLIAPRPTLLRATVEPSAVTITPGREPAVLTVNVTNLSSIVDRYLVEIPDAPSWLAVSPAEVRLNPNTDETATVTLSILLMPMVPAGEHQLVVRISSVTTPDAVHTADLQLTVGVIDGPIGLALEPSLIRIRDTGDARLQVVAENRTSNRAVPLTLEGSDPEQAVRFVFDPPVLLVPAGGSAQAVARLSVPIAEAGQEVTRQLTVTATEGTREFSVMGTLVQATTAEVLRMNLEPSLIKVRDTGGAEMRLVIDNPTGFRPVRLMLLGTDPERAVRFTFSPPVVEVRPGGSVGVRVHLEAPQPEAGQEISRQLTITASDNQREISATGTLVQKTSVTVLAMRMEPSVVRVRDSYTGFGQVVVDNRAGTRPVRLALEGSDPEAVVRFSFYPPMIELAAGEIAAARLQMEGPLPEWGREASRAITVRASDGVRSAEATGTFVQSASEPAMSTLELRLDPSIVRARGSDAGHTVLVADNRAGATPVVVQLQGSDPERAIEFFFEPPVLEVPAGTVGGSHVQLRAPRPARGQESNRPITVTASDNRRTLETSGSFVQTSADRRPIWRIVLTILGALLMIAGVFLPWTVLPTQLWGFDWSLVQFAQETHIDLSRLNFNLQVLQQIPKVWLSAGLVVLIFAGVTLFGLTGGKGRLTRTGAGLSLLFVIAFSTALIVRAPGGWEPGWGSYLIAAGAICGFAGGLFAKR